MSLICKYFRNARLDEEEVTQIIISYLIIDLLGFWKAGLTQ